MVSQVERYYPRTRRAVGPVSQTDRFYDDTRNDVRCPYADELGELDEVKKHLGRTDNPHGVTAEQVGAVPLLGAGESADPDTHGKTALVTQNGDEGGFAVSGQAGADPDSEAYVTRYQRESITAFGADEAEVERYLIGPQNRNQDESILRVGDLAATKPVTVTPESVAYVQKVTLALQIDRETIAHANSADAIDWVPSSKAVQAALDKKAEKTHTHTTAQVTGLDAALAQKANSADVYKKTETDGRYLQLTGGTLTGSLTVNASITASSFKIPQGSATHTGEVISIKNGPTMAGAVGIVYKRPQQSNFKPVFLGVSGGDTDSRIQLGDGSTPNADSGLTVVFGLHTPDDRTWARHDLWFTDKFGDAQGTRKWWGLVQDGDELRIVKDKGTPKAYLPLNGGTLSGNLKFSNESSELWVSNIKSYAGTPIYDVTFNKGFNFLSIYQLTGYTASGQRGKVFFTQENATTNWLDVTTLKEGGTPIADKYAAKTHTHTTAQVTGLDAALAAKANSADVYPKAQTYTKTEVDTLVAQAVATAKAELLEQLKGLYAPLSSVQATVGGTTYRWAWDDTFQTFAMKAVEEA